MNDLSQKMQPPQGEDIGQEAQQPVEVATNQQDDGSAGTYQQGLPPVQGSYQQYIPPGGYQQYGYQPNPPEQQQYAGYQQQKQQYAPQYTGGVGPFETTSLGMRARTAGLL